MEQKKTILTYAGLKKLEELIPLIGPVRRATLEYGKYTDKASQKAGIFRHYYRFLHVICPFPIQF